MPILPAEPDVFPATLLDEPCPGGTEGRSWRVLHTKPRQEKALARQLYQGQIPFYLPLISRRCVVRGRVLVSCIPLFAGYCFVMVDEAQRIRTLATRRVVRALEVPDQGQLWTDLRSIRTLIATGAPITPEGRLVPGAAVEIRSGPLAGLKGVIIRRANHHRFVVRVDFIQQGASVELDDFMLAKAI